MAAPHSSPKRFLPLVFLRRTGLGFRLSSSEFKRLVVKARQMGNKKQHCKEYQVCPKHIVILGPARGPSGNKKQESHLGEPGGRTRACQVKEFCRTDGHVSSTQPPPLHTQLPLLLRCSILLSANQHPPPGPRFLLPHHRTLR